MSNAEMIREICRHMTREQAAERLECSVGTIDRYKGKNPPGRTYETLAGKIRAVYGEVTEDCVVAR